MIIYDNERIDGVNDSLSLIQKTDGLTFGTDALLLAGYVSGKYANGAELGGGSGIISMLLLSRRKIDLCTAYEIQPEYAELISRNAEYNSLSERLLPVCADVREISSTEGFDIVFTNPMYEVFADLHVHIGRSETGKPIKITAARSLNFANIAKECAERIYNDYVNVRNQKKTRKRKSCILHRF